MGADGGRGDRRRGHQGRRARLTGRAWAGTRLLERARRWPRGSATTKRQGPRARLLAERLPERLLERALTAAEGSATRSPRPTRSAHGRAPAGAAPDRDTGAGADGGRGIGDEYAKAGALGFLAERLPERLLERALTAAEGIGNDGAKAGALGSLAERLPEPRRTEILERAMTAAEGIGNSTPRPARSAHWRSACRSAFWSGR